jgi:hypothetical protein
MANKDRRAIVLEKLFRAYKEYGADTSIIADDELDDELALAHGDSAMVIRSLAKRGLADAGDDGLGAFGRLTLEGIEAIENPASEEHRLVELVQHVNVSGGHVQIGSNNTMNITYSQALASLAERIEEAPDVPPAQKSTWLATVRDIAKHPLTAAALKIATDVLVT